MATLITNAKGNWFKLRTGAWGVRTEDPVRAGSIVNVSRKDGTVSVETVEKVVWTDGTVSLCAVMLREKTPSRTARKATAINGRSTRRQKTGCACGSYVGEYHDWYCDSCRFDELDM